MEILVYSGIPGSGKTLDATHDALKHFKKENFFLKKYFYILFSGLHNSFGDKCKSKLEYYKLFPYEKINSVYSSYPILLYKKKNFFTKEIKEIYSHQWSIFDFQNQYSFIPNALFVDDELQLKIDSEDYKSKSMNFTISKIAKFMQSARHFGCSQIILCTQHPSRAFKKCRNVASGFVQHKRIFKVPILNIGFLYTIKYFILDDYGKFIPRSHEERKRLPFEYKKKLKFINYNKVFKSYDSRYLSKYNYSKPLSNRGVYHDKKVEMSTLITYFEGDF